MAKQELFHRNFVFIDVKGVPCLGGVCYSFVKPSRACGKGLLDDRKKPQLARALPDRGRIFPNSKAGRVPASRMYERKIMLDQAYSRRQFLGLAGGLASIVGLGLVGCGGSGASDTADKGSAAAAESVSGEVTYDGASSFQALVEAAAEKFMDANPDVSVSGSGNGSGKGLTAVAAGTVTIGNSDVFAETKLEADQVKNLVDHEVAVVGMGPVVSKNVTVDDLSLEQLKGIFSGQITNWKEVGGDDATIVVLNRKAGSGTRATFEATVFGDEAVDFKGDAELDKSGDVQTQMGSTDNAISYLDFSHFDDSKFNAIKVEGVEPKSANVTDDSFKIWATEHMYCAKDADEATKAFLEFMLSDDVQGKLVEEQGFIPVSAMKVVKDASGKVSAK